MRLAPIRWDVVTAMMIMIMIVILLQIEEFKKFASEADAYKSICSKIAPSIFGHEDVKKAVACLLFGGSRKVHSELRYIDKYS